MAYKGYETSKDYSFLKTLLDEGYKIIGFAKNTLVTIQKAEEGWFPYVAYGLTGEDLSRNCHTNEDFYAWCREYDIEWLTMNSKRNVQSIYNKERTHCIECDCGDFIEYYTARNGHKIYRCKYCGKEYIEL